MKPETDTMTLRYVRGRCRSQCPKLDGRLYPTSRRTKGRRVYAAARVHLRVLGPGRVCRSRRTRIELCELSSRTEGQLR